MRLNTSDPAVHQEGIGTSDDAAHSGMVGVVVGKCSCTHIERKYHTVYNGTKLVSVCSDCGRRVTLLNALALRIAQTIQIGK